MHQLTSIVVLLHAQRCKEVKSGVQCARTCGSALMIAAWFGDLKQGIVNTHPCILSSTARIAGAMCTELLPEPFKAEAKPGAQVPLPGDILGGGGSDLGDSLEVKRWQGLIVTDTVSMSGGCFLQQGV
jgi:hypothetical protein